MATPLQVSRCPGECACHQQAPHNRSHPLWLLLKFISSHILAQSLGASCQEESREPPNFVFLLLVQRTIMEDKNIILRQREFNSNILKNNFNNLFFTKKTKTNLLYAWLSWLYDERKKKWLEAGSIHGDRASTCLANETETQGLFTGVVLASALNRPVSCSSPPQMRSVRLAELDKVSRSTPLATQEVPRSFPQALHSCPSGTLCKQLWSQEATKLTFGAGRNEIDTNIVVVHCAAALSPVFCTLPSPPLRSFSP